MSGGTRAAKLIARAGLCSRREAEAWIGEGRVALNGKPLTDPSVRVRRNEKIMIDGKPLVERARTRLFLFHKPRGLVATARDPQGRPTIFDYLREHWPKGPRVVSVGRLDINSEGLLLLTNDGGLARVLELPSTGWMRRYRVRAKGHVSQAILDSLQKGMTVEGMTYAGIGAALDRVQGANCWLTMALREGRNREVKRVLESLGLKVNRLIRISFGPFQLGDLGEGIVEEVRTRVLREQLGPSLAKAAGADFSSQLHREKGGGEAAVMPAPRAHQGGVRKPPVESRPSALSLPAAIEPRPARNRRKHISVLRAGHDGKPKARKRIELGKTEDRAGRAVYVERLVAATGEAQGQGADKRQPKKRAKFIAHNPHHLKEQRRDRKENFPRRRGEKAVHGQPRRPRRKK
jgi:23S rRNA pseudouridine2605 synthase